MGWHCKTDVCFLRRATALVFFLGIMAGERTRLDPEACGALLKGR